MSESGGLSPEEQGAKVQETLEAAIAESLRYDDEFAEGAMVTGWVVVVEGMGPDGKRWLSLNSNRDAMTWQVKGYLHEALDYEQKYGGKWRHKEDEEEP